MSFKPSEALRFLAGLGVAAVVGLLIVVRVTSCAPAPSPPGVPAQVGKLTPALPPPAAVAPQPIFSGDCANGPPAAAAANAASLHGLAHAAFKRQEIGWAIYAPLIAREIGTGCPPQSPGFARAFADWQTGQKLPSDGVLTEANIKFMKGIIESRRPIVLLYAQKICAEPASPDRLVWGRTEEGYSGKPIQLRPAVWAAYRRMVTDARAAVPAIAADPRNLTIFSGFRAPEADLARCATEGGCDGVTRAIICSPHRTGLAMDIYVGEAPGFRPDSSADPNRLFMSQTPTYRWLVANADRYGFAPYPFEPWHWEWTGEAP